MFIKNLAFSLVAVMVIFAGLMLHAGEKEATEAKPYPLDTCIVAGSKLGSMGDPIVYVHKGQEVKFCCAGCIGAFKKNPDKYLAKLTVNSKKTDKSATTQPATQPAEKGEAKTEKSLNNRICLVMPYSEIDKDRQVVEHNGVKINLCCKMCVKKFKADPDKYIPKHMKSKFEKKAEEKKTEKNDHKHHDH